MLQNRNQFSTTQHSHKMKVMGVGNVESFFSSLKIFLNIGWFIGIFPVKFDGSLTSFKYKFFSFTTFFSFVRMAFFIFLFLLPNIVLDTVDFVAKNSTESAFNKTSDFIGEKGIVKNTADYLIERVELFLGLLNVLGKYLRWMINILDIYSITGGASCDMFRPWQLNDRTG